MNEQERRRAFVMFVAMQGNWNIWVHWLATYASLHGDTVDRKTGRTII